MKDTFTLPKDLIDDVEPLSGNEQVELLDCILAHANGIEWTSFSPGVDIIMERIIPVIDTGKTEENTATHKFEFQLIWDIYKKKVGHKTKLKKKWDKLSAKVQALALDHIPKYVDSTPEKNYRMNLETYLNNEGWNNEIISNNAEQSISCSDRQERLVDIAKQMPDKH